MFQTLRNAPLVRRGSLLYLMLACLSLAVPAQHLLSEEPLLTLRVPANESATVKAAEAEPIADAAPDEEAMMDDPLMVHDFPLAKTLRIEPSRSKLVRTKKPVMRVSITDPNILDVTQYGPDEFEFIGHKSGETTLTMWYGQQGEEPSVVRYLVQVGPGTATTDRANVEYRDLERRINELFPNSQVQLIPVLDKLVVRGQARDSEEAAQIMSLIRQQTSGWGAFGGGGAFGVNQGSVAVLPDARDLPNYNVISLLEVPGEQQVMLKVRIAELTRTALRELGADFDLNFDHFSISSFLGAGGNVSAILDDGDVALFIRAFSSNGYGKILAEPTLVTISGATANFIAGGEFAVPTAVGVDGVAAATTTFRGFGTQLAFTPTVLDKDRIRLKVKPSFSTLNNENAVNGIPGLNTRGVETVVDLREGQWLAIAGLIQDQQGGTRDRIPFLGDIPIAGMVLGNQSVRREETELVVLVSPELVHPLEFEQVPLLLPGMEVTEPADCEFFFHQWIEGAPDCEHRSTVWPHYKQRLCQEEHHGGAHPGGCRATTRYQECQNYYVHGPTGFSE